MAQISAPSSDPTTPPASCRALLRPAIVRGTGLFTGKPATVVIRPGSGPGLSFRRADTILPALVDRVVADGRHTVLTPPGGSSAGPIQTTEHLLAALAGLGIWSAEIELDGPEVPIMDGSAEPFVRAILAAGVITRPAPRPASFIITRPIAVEAGAARIEASPLPGGGPARLEAEYALDYGESGPIPRPAAHVTIAADVPDADFATSVAPARTFSLLAEALAARQAGLFAHVTPAEMVVVGDDGRPVDNKWRFDHEPARHKLLDLVGDLALVGGPVVGRVVARRSGHALNHAMARAIREAFAPT